MLTESLTIVDNGKGSIVSESTMLLQLAVEKGLDTDKLEKLIELRNRELSRQAKEEFDRHFAEMQAELPVIEKGEAATDRNGKVMYFYAPLDILQAAAGPVIARHGFSYSWREEALEIGKRVVLVITGHGHSRETSFDVPPVQPNSMQNEVQAVGAMSTFGKRYTFQAGFGLIVTGEDTDSAGAMGVYAQMVADIEGAKTIEALQTVWKKHYDALAGDNTGRKCIVEAKDKRKKELMNGPKN